MTNPKKFIKNSTYDLDFLESACDLVAVAPIDCDIDNFGLWRRAASYMALSCLCAPQENEYYFLDGESFAGFSDKLSAISDDELKQAARAITSTFEQHTHIVTVRDNDGNNHTFNILRFITHVPAEDTVRDYLSSKALIVTQSDSGFYTPKENFYLCVTPDVEDESIVAL